MCECILCLLDEVNHFEWREKAQRYGIHNHQHLENYRDLILSKFNTLQNISDCTAHKGLFPASIKFWEDSRKSIDYETIAKEFFTKIETIYNLWNSGDAYNATQKLDNLIEDIENKKKGKNYCDKDTLPLFLFRERTDGETQLKMVYGTFHLMNAIRFKTIVFQSPDDRCFI